MTWDITCGFVSGGAAVAAFSVFVCAGYREQWARQLAVATREGRENLAAAHTVEKWTALATELKGQRDRARAEVAELHAAAHSLAQKTLARTTDMAGQIDELTDKLDEALTALYAAKAAAAALVVERDAVRLDLGYACHGVTGRDAELVEARAKLAARTRDLSDQLWAAAAGRDAARAERDTAVAQRDEALIERDEALAEAAAGAEWSDAEYDQLAAAVRAAAELVARKEAS